MGLTLKQQKFVDAYCGNASAAARAAGYSEKTAYAIGDKLLKKTEIISAIKQRQDEAREPLIATREARQKFWSETMLNPEVEMQHRLKAAELLGRSEGDFCDKLTLDHDVNLTVGYLFEPRVRAELLREIGEE